MSREDIKKMLGENATDEQITAVLNTIHSEKAKADKLEAQLNAKSVADEENAKTMKELQEKLNKFEKEKMSEAERLEAEKKEIAKNLANSRMILAKAKAQEILSQVGITDDDIIETVTNDNLDTTIARATALANKFKTVTEETAKKTKEELANLDIKPTQTNIPQGDDVMTLDKFQNLSADEQEKFINEHPEEFEKL